VIDNASDQDIEGVVAAFNDQRVSFIRNEFNIGAAGSFKKACDIARGDFLMIFHDDDCAHPRLLEWEIRAISEIPNAVQVITGGVFVNDPSNMFDFDQEARFGYATYEDDYELFRAGVFGLKIPGKCIGFGGTLYRTSVVKECRPLLDGLIERLSPSADRPWLYTLAQRGRTIFLDSPMYNIRSHYEQDSQRGLERYQYCLRADRYVLDQFATRMDKSLRLEVETGISAYILKTILWHIRNKPARLSRLLEDIGDSQFMPVSKFARYSATLIARGLVKRALHVLVRNDRIPI
jgi:hypothetical protein